jgi:hypothetical protein
MNKAQWALLLTFAARFYSVGTIWMTHVGWRLWPYVGPGDFGAYHGAWWSMIQPTIFPMGAVALFGSIAMIWWRPEGVNTTPIWLNLDLQLATYALTAIFSGRWQAQMDHARLPDASLDPMYVLAMSTHWIRAALVTANGLVVFWMLIEHLSSKPRIAVS